jgi:hypothetical protein
LFCFSHTRFCSYPFANLDLGWCICTLQLPGSALAISPLGAPPCPGQNLIFRVFALPPVTLEVVSYDSPGL